MQIPHSEQERREAQRLLDRVPAQANLARERLTTTSYHVDRAVREALLAPASYWYEENSTLAFTASNTLQVYLGRPQAPLELSEARSLQKRMGLSTALTARIAPGLWLERRSHDCLSETGLAPLRLAEVLEWRGIQKQGVTVRTGEDEPRRSTQGYHARSKSQVLSDMQILSACVVAGSVTTFVSGRAVQVPVQSNYLTAQLVPETLRGDEERIAGLLVAPGNWIKAYEEQDNFFLANYDRRLLQLPANQHPHALRIGLYLAERWRQLAHKGNFDKPIMMIDLLAASMIPVDRRRLATRFGPMIEQALSALWQQGILCEPASCRRWDGSGARFSLLDQWTLLPSAQIRETYQAMITTQPATQKLPPQPQKKLIQIRRRGGVA